MSEANVIPRRMSVSDEDIDWDIAARLEILVDGGVVGDVTAFDCDAGTVERLVTDEDDRLVMRGDEVATETLRGVVTVRFKDAA